MDTGNNDARTEGMSYGMMMAVQLDQQDVFDKLWLFSHTFMQQHDGDNEGYFAWSVSPEGKKFSEGPAPDGEEYFALALFFASSRWGDRQAPFDYSHQARKILRHCLHQDELVEGGHTMWDLTNYYIKFVPSVDFSDHPTTCPISMRYLPREPMNRTEIFGQKQLKPVETIFVNLVIHQPECQQNMPSMTVGPNISMEKILISIRMRIELP